MTLRRDFTFSQHKLQDYEDCPRRFQLRYMERRDWPALQSEPVQERERHMLLGVQFHELVHRANLGMDMVNLAATSIDTDLQRWWRQYLEHGPDDLPATRLTEFTLSAPFVGYRLTAKYDLLAIQPGERMVIVDWKTGLRPPRMDVLRNRVQTRLYPMLVVLAGQSVFNNTQVLPHEVEMIYWFASQPETPVHIYYDIVQFERDMIDFGRQITEIANCAPEEFAMAGSDRVCGFCNYRSLCGRGKRAGDWNEAGEDGSDPTDFDLGDLGELPF